MRQESLRTHRGRRVNVTFFNLRSVTQSSWFAGLPDTLRSCSASEETSFISMSLALIASDD